MFLTDIYQLIRSRYRKNENQYRTKCLLAIFFLLFIGLLSYNAHQKYILEKDSLILNNMRYSTSEFQRATKLKLENSADTSLNQVVNNSIFSFTVSSNIMDYFHKDEEISARLKQAIIDWDKLVYIIAEFENTSLKDELFKISESIYQDSILIMKVIQSHIENETKNIFIMNIIIDINLLIMALLTIKMIFDMKKEIEQNIEFTQSMNIDKSTGLFNRSKCQEILMEYDDGQEIKGKALIIFKLKGIKTINKKHGYKAGNEYIYNFSSKLKEASESFRCENFVGRYENNVFIAYFSAVDERGIKSYINDVEYLIEEVNRDVKATKRINFTSVYNITNEENRDMTLLELFESTKQELHESF